MKIAKEKVEYFQVARRGRTNKSWLFDQHFPTYSKTSRKKVDDLKLFYAFYYGNLNRMNFE